MNWKLVAQLSGFGLIMAVCTIALIPTTIEPACWVVVFLLSAYAIGRAGTGAPFVHGVLTGLANCVWVTGAHVIFARTYLAHHTQEAQMMARGPLAHHPRLMMLLTGPVIGLVSGVIIGLLALAAARFLSPAPRQAAV